VVPERQIRLDLLDQAGLLWDHLKRTKKDRKEDVTTLALFIETVHQQVIRSISDYVSMHAINVAKGNPTHGEAVARQGLLVRALAEVANKILTLEIRREPVKNDSTPEEGSAE